MEWGHSRSLHKWSGHPAAEYEHKTKVSEFLMYAGIETLFLGPKHKDSHAFLYFTLRQSLTTARDRRMYVPFPTKIQRLSSRKVRQEANKQNGTAQGSLKAQGKSKSKVKGKAAKLNKPANEL